MSAMSGEQSKDIKEETDEQKKKRTKDAKRIFVLSGGGDRVRTGVQTYSPKAFYMLISSINCRRSAGNEQTN
jgi:hypothetical protein